ncbi:ABC transporter ATP-binding protein [Flavobacteriaceae bacterium]|jgi:lipoprotein-releasing system ATP-binding protein|nr:ABC transporter ATP-binding protein [Flavobacteriaceae bacterium]MDB4097764.1 ABC transporter ATP-binding protein [Flavobacteriaceae bacterium]MDC1396451.1 ABC transporter ATP-binding protein [Flavobacteriaceae bacterium]|tara:strand:- start:2320 stop:2979 length:660 start_codon:yes stop_codon:yes gene_type:complete
MILVKNISKTYNNKKVVNKIDLNVKKGEIISIIGPSGAGKTTLLNLISTLDSPDKNNDSIIKINDVDVLSLNDKNLSKFRNTQIGFIFQFHELLPEFTALENVIIPAIIKGENKNISINKAKNLLKTLGLLSVINQFPSQLSGGEQQRVAVARALINDPKVIFADEPSGNLDSKSSDLLHKLFFDLRDKLNITFIIVTHNKELSNMTDRKLNLVDGKWA